MSVHIASALSNEDVAAVAGLFAAYQASLDVDLGYQDFAAELAGLPGDYAPPRGALLLARDPGGRPLGCVGLRPKADAVCEMKRLFVADEARGLGLGQALIDRVVAEAERLGYREIRLDTLPSMTAAIALYRVRGFVEIAPYYEGAPAGTIFLAKPLGST